MMVQQIQEKKRVQLFSVFQLSTMDSNADICFEKVSQQFSAIIAQIPGNYFCIETCKIVAISLCLKKRISLSLTKLKKEHPIQVST